MINEHDCVVLTQDLPNQTLKAGDMGTVIHIHQGGAGYEVEFMTLAGETVAVATLLPLLGYVASPGETLLTCANWRPGSNSRSKRTRWPSRCWQIFLRARLP